MLMSGTLGAAAPAKSTDAGYRSLGIRSGRTVAMETVATKLAKATDSRGFFFAFNELGWCCKRGLNSRPLPYQGSALPLSYCSFRAL